MFRKILELQEQGQRSVLVTITNTKGSTPREMGAKMLVTRDRFFGTIGGGELEKLAIEKSRDLLRSESPERMAVPLCSKAHQCCGGFVELFFDVIRPQPQLLIFGAGHVAQALLECLAGTAFHCHVIDSRSEWIKMAQDKVPALRDLSLTVHHTDPVTFAKGHQPLSDDQTWAVVMTHDHSLDEELIGVLAPRSLKYLGLIGSRTKRERFLKRLSARGISSGQLERLFCPMGLPSGGKAPKEVALSIATQLIQSLYAEPKDRTIVAPDAEAVL